MFSFFRKKPPTDSTRGNQKSSPSPLDLALQESDFPAAIAILEAETNPDMSKLFLRVEMKIFWEDFDGALGDLNRMWKMDPSWDMYEEFLAIVQSGRAWHHRQTIPDYPTERSAFSQTPSPGHFIQILAMQFHAKGEIEEAKNAIVSAKKQLPRLSGILYFTGGKQTAFTNIFDVDDLTGPTLVCAGPGGLLDIPFEQIAEVEFAPRQGFPYSHWNLALVRTRAGEEAYVRVFAYYVGTGRHEAKEVRSLGFTSWDHSRDYAVVYGQRDLQLEHPGGGISLVGINQVSRLVFQSVSFPTTEPDNADPTGSGDTLRI